MSARFFLRSGLILIILAVVFGAFGAHAIRAIVSPQQLVTWQTASEYHFIHALGLIALGMWMSFNSANLWLRTSGYSLIMGIVLFSGSLYLLVLTGNTSLGMVTPFGGVLFIVGWLCWLISIARDKSQPES